MPACPPLRFCKMHGAGNDFVIVDARTGAPTLDAGRCRALADRHTGVGCDQILTIESPRRPGSLAAYRIWNADGSSSKQCGNGARCVAAWLVRDGAPATGFVLDGPARAHAVARRGTGDFSVVMGVPDFAPEGIGLQGFDAACDRYSVEIGGSNIQFGAVSMGNPHALVEIDDIAVAPLATTGRQLQKHACFPESANIGFAQILSRKRVALRVLERGVGETLACGSGACAAAAVLMRRGRVERDISVALAGGTLRVSWPRDDAPMILAGPAEFVFEGEWIA